MDNPLFVALEISGQFWFAPSWGSNLDYYPDEVFSIGLTEQMIIDPFPWPAGAGESSGGFWIVLTDPAIQTIVGDYAHIIFTWTE